MKTKALILTLLLFLALSLCAAAQTLVGMPDATITGPASNPVMENRSSKTIVATLLVIGRADGSHQNLIRIHKAGVAPGATAEIGMSPHAHTLNSDVAITDSTLHAVMFSDGEIRGDDPTGHFKERASQGLAQAREWVAATKRRFKPEGYYTYLRSAALREL